jgi:hypothetical protein
MHDLCMVTLLLRARFGNSERIPNMMKNIKKAFQDCFLTCLFTALSFFLIGPVNLYVSNAGEFAFYLTDILPLLLLCTVLCFGILFGVCCLIKKRKPRSVFSAVVLGVGLGFFIQSTFMSGGYGQLNGQQIDWSSMIGRGLLNTTIWILCISIPVSIAKAAGKGKRFEFQKYLSGGVMAIQILSLLVTILVSGSVRPNKNEEFVISTADAFTLSKNKNVVVFLLDNFSSELYEEIINEDASYQDKFDGFTYFPDTSGAGCTTKGSLPYILTGMWNENTMKYKDYLNKGYDNQLYKTLDELDYDTRLFVEKKYVGSQSIDFFNNMYREKATVSAGKTTGLMYKFTAFTHMPHFLKPLFWFYTGEFTETVQAPDSDLKLTPDPTFYKSLVNNGISINDTYQGAYRFYYLSGAHSPFNMNEEAEAVPSGSVDMKQRAKGALKIVSTYLQQLREKDLYDDTMVIVLADHGNWEADVVFNPMLFVKPFDSETKGIAVNNAPISYADLMPTQLEAITGKDAGTTVFEVEENQERERRFLFYAWDGSWDSDYLPDLHEYIIYGNIRDIASRVPTGNVYTPDGLVVNTIGYELGTELIYNESHSDSPTYVLYGLFYPESGHTWTKGNYTTWAFPLKDYRGGDLRFTLDLASVKNGSQRVGLTVNDRFVEEVTVTGGGKLSFTIPAELVGEGRLMIRFDMPDATGGEKDTRVLSLAIKSVTLDYAE